ncbi:MAG: polyprenyl synthetase family protein [Acidimicrobiia bacterium]|jgi:heptaprenyl diphosphate synthase
MNDLRTLVDIPRVWERMERLEHRLFEASSSEDPYLTKIAQHLLAAGGKRFRPLLALLAAELGPGDDHAPVEAGVSVELIHLGSLYHDDVIDEADTRRGAASVNSNWTNTVAILAGDFLMARASEVAATHLDQESVRLLAATYAELVEGQTLELQYLDDLDHGIEAYEQVIGGKTASLIRTSARLGARAARADTGVVEAVSTWAWELGMVFQIADDALDLIATQDLLGKPAGSDVREGTFTMPVLLAARGPEALRIRRLLAGPRPHADEAVDEVISIVRDAGYVDTALDGAKARLAVARNALTEVPAGKARDVLGRMGDYLLERVEEARGA